MFQERKVLGVCSEMENHLGKNSMVGKMYFPALVERYPEEYHTTHTAYKSL